MKIEHHADISEPEYIKKKDCLVIKSPESLTIKPREDALLDLKFNITLEHLPMLHMHQTWLKLSTIFSLLGLYIENGEQWATVRTKNNAIQLPLLNRSFYYDVKIKEGDIIGYVFLLGKLNTQNINVNYQILKN